MVRDLVGEWSLGDWRPHIEDELRVQKEESTMSQPLLSGLEVGQTMDMTIQRKGRICLRSGEKIEKCPHCNRLGMRKLMMDGRIRYVHVLQVGVVNFLPLDACTMWERTEFILRYGYDGLHHNRRKTGDDNQAVEEIR